MDASSLLLDLCQRYQAERSRDALLRAQQEVGTARTRLLLAVVGELRQLLQHRITRWKEREAEAQQQPGFHLGSLEAFVQADPLWKQPLRQRLEHLRSELPHWAPSPTQGRGLFGSLRATVDGSLRDDLPRRIFEQLQSALERGLENYHRELLYALDRLWDDFLDSNPHPQPQLGLQRNPALAEEYLQLLRPQLQLRFQGGFTLPRSWMSRPDLWVRSSQSWPVAEMVREIEVELIVQLAPDTAPLHQNWLGRVGAFYGEQGDGRSQLSREQEQLRQDWQMLHQAETLLQV